MQYFLDPPLRAKTSVRNVNRSRNLHENAKAFYAVIHLQVLTDYDMTDVHSATLNIPVHVQQSSTFLDFTPQLINVDTDSKVS